LLSTCRPVYGDSPKETIGVTADCLHRLDAAGAAFLLWPLPHCVEHPVGVARCYHGRIGVPSHPGEYDPNHHLVTA
jgi:hypothetical protein